MQQIIHLWQAMDTRRRIIVSGAVAVMFWAVLALARMASEPGMTLLYAGLESGAAGEVVAALEQHGVAYDVRGGAIFVDAVRRDELRMTLAGEGLPSASVKGYELLDGLSGFGTTSQMFSAAYWRAKEGELTRTIVSHPAISAARVHISSSGSNPFQRDIRPSASVSITASRGAISAKHARALQFLVASAVAGLTPEEVSVIDAEGGLVGATEETPANTAEDRAEVLRHRAERLLAARVGPGNAVVEVAVDTITQTESIRERHFDPEGRVAISTDTEERTNTASDEAGGDVTVASNLPDGDAAQGGASASETSETRERINYEVSATEREITHVPGAIKRLSVAVLVNGTTTTDATGASVFEPRPEEELAALRDLVASAVGFDEARGDVITMRTMQFERLEPEGTLAESGLLDRLALDVMSLIQAGVLAAVALILGLFVIRPLFARPITPPPAQIVAPARPIARTDPVAASPALTGEIDEGDFDETGLSVIAEDRTARKPEREFAALERSTEDPVARLRNMIGQRQEETVEILRSWLEGEEEKV
ncbi:flagellar M-ring protein FliF [Roseovarius azorensis]|uniref:Flagellar M-ring protein n=1 Tax=Roseovarius azorensis TaxID=1287727 RepID=A0A1H7R413_9RHOB|nr:flagellar basal-body MS-ring/collar protein FliF [Roseovarius azorensis]SEL54913.1 flagellar M-ring protein FliF [Roseovarius azorensis]